MLFAFYEMKNDCEEGENFMYIVIVLINALVVLWTAQYITA